MGGRLIFDLSSGASGVPRRGRTDDSPFRLLLVGDFSGRAAAADAGGEVIQLRRPLSIDAGDLDRAVATMKVALPIAVPGMEKEIARFESIDDLHPDALFSNLSGFEEPRRLRAALTAPAATQTDCAVAEQWLSGLSGLGGPSGPSRFTGSIAGVETPVGDVPAAETVDATVERLLGRGRVSASPRARTDGAMSDAFIASVVRPHIVPDVSARRAVVLAALDEVLTLRMREILSTPRFRALEGTWRGVDRVARALDTDTDLQIALLDASRADLVRASPASTGDLQDLQDLQDSTLNRLIAGDERGWSAIAADLAFDLTPADLRLLAVLGAISVRAGGALLADAAPAVAPAVLGVRTLADLADLHLTQSAGAIAAPLSENPGAADWEQLRDSTLGRSIALCVPRLLMRLPYGKRTDPISSFAFEELPPGAGGLAIHRVWGSAAFGVAQAWGAAFRERGWSFDLEAALDLTDLPAHTFDDDGQSRLVSPTEVALGERAGLALVAAGMTPLLARPDRAHARLLGISSIARSRMPLR